MLWDPKKDVDLSKPSLEGLSYLLRNKGLWPKGFAWDYTSNLRCAIALGKETWGRVAWQGHEMHMPVSDYSRIFCAERFRRTYNVHCLSDVTPELVADKIDQYLSGDGLDKVIN